MDLRLPIGGLFAIFGVILTIFGMVSNKAIYAQSLNYNVNLDWGLVLLVFGGLMLIFAYFGKEPDFLENHDDSTDPKF